jgi:hypothetical protein
MTTIFRIFNKKPTGRVHQVTVTYGCLTEKWIVFIFGMKIIAMNYNEADFTLYHRGLFAGRNFTSRSKRR